MAVSVAVGQLVELRKRVAVREPHAVAVDVRHVDGVSERERQRVRVWVPAPERVRQRYAVAVSVAVGQLVELLKRVAARAPHAVPVDVPDRGDTSECESERVGAGA